MPRNAERKLRRQAREMGLKGKDANAYVYGALRRMGWKPRRKRG